MNALLHGPLLWYLNRSTGLVVLALLTATAVLGVLATGRGGRLLPRFVGQSLHRNLALWSVVLLVAARDHRGRRRATSTSAGGRPSCRGSARPTSRSGSASGPWPST